MVLRSGGATSSGAIVPVTIVFKDDREMEEMVAI
jgi:hypothetical protein